ncbi:hypothetical protein DPEC_G00084640 [Dallia pectoralis]|uniref:Uncharacterized protein n=1 Tax=Dallia pectoralis TaxID=75939 RepID=A0ACC2GZI4_DALPE|nr:hypothetical protein DPEC_G00084640 [Dallia pectoralis]
MCRKSVVIDKEDQKIRVNRLHPEQLQNQVGKKRQQAHSPWEESQGEFPKTSQRTGSLRCKITGSINNI